jgi:hypothetical protein
MFQFISGVVFMLLILATIWVTQPGQFQAESDYLLGKNPMPEQQVREGGVTYDLANPVNLTEPCIPGTELDQPYSVKTSQGLTEIQYCSSQEHADNGNNEVCACFKIESRYWWVIENWQSRLTATDYANYPQLERGNYSGYGTWDHLNIAGCELNKTECQEPYQYKKLYPVK